MKKRCLCVFVIMLVMLICAAACTNDDLDDAAIQGNECIDANDSENTSNIGVKTTITVGEWAFSDTVGKYVPSGIERVELMSDGKLFFDFLDDELGKTLQSTYKIKRYQVAEKVEKAYVFDYGNNTDKIIIWLYQDKTIAGVDMYSIDEKQAINEYITDFGGLNNIVDVQLKLIEIVPETLGGIIEAIDEQGDSHPLYLH